MVSYNFRCVKPKMISLSEFAFEVTTTHDVIKTDIGSTFSSSMASSISDNFNYLRESVPSTLPTELVEDIYKKDISFRDFTDTDSGLGDSTPPSPTWTYTEGCDEASSRMQISTECTQKNVNNFCYWDKVDVCIDKGEL